MKKASEILTYLEALATELARLGGKQQYHILVTGGAFMLLQGERRTTNDIDFAIVAPERKPKAGRVFSTTVQRKGEVATRGSRGVFSQAVEAVATSYQLQDDWINDESAAYLYDDAPGADIYLWQSWAGVLFVYLPTAEYVFALKVTAYRRKDQPDCKRLAHTLGITTPEQAQAVIDRYILPEAQTFWEVEKKLKRLFR
ncbi:MAG: hypothetical protein ACRDHW_00465 [Ktedonobacteraceae bacterium]